MSSIGTPENPLRVAIVGSGPAGFYAAGDLLSNKEEVSVEVDMYDRLPTPLSSTVGSEAWNSRDLKSRPH